MSDILSQHATKVAPEVALRAYSTKLEQWLLEDGFNTWWHRGADKAGGFHERVAFDGAPVLDDNRRARVQPRQAYCYAKAGVMGWDGPWREAVQHGLKWFELTYTRSDGLYGTLADYQGNLIDHEFDLYNHSFALLGLASAAATIPELFEEYHSRGLQIVAMLKANYRHAIGGFHMADPPREPLCTNPHMHMLEAALAWETAAPMEHTWAVLADEIATLSLTHLIDPASGALREYYDFNWQPMKGSLGRKVEPGHQFEWAWLLTIWSERRRNPQALANARRLFDIAERHGICPDRNVAIMSLYDDFTVQDDLARLWSQTEWLKSALRLAANSSNSERQRYLRSAVKAAAALQMFIDGAPRALWYDKYSRHYGFLQEPAPASTFYHIVAASLELRSLTTSDNVPDEEE